MRPSCPNPFGSPGSPIRVTHGMSLKGANSLPLSLLVGDDRKVKQGIKAHDDSAVKGPVGQLLDFFRYHWSRGEPGRETPQWIVLLAYRMWLIALLFKLLGSSWDESWHFKWQRDDLAPPHL